MVSKHQMSIEFHDEFGQSKPTLPLKETGNIVNGNACRLNWNKVCPKDDNETYIIGNPPYLGSSMQNKKQKKDMTYIFENFKNYKNLDYIACWFYLVSEYIINEKIKSAFVSTNSICQGEQVGLLWPNILNKNIEICFAYQSFEWKNNAKNNAGVSVIIIGLSKITKKSKHIYNNKTKRVASNINSYLLDSSNIIISKRSEPISELSVMIYGNKAVYGEPLILSLKEKNELIIFNSDSKKFIKKLIGAKEFIDGKKRWCLWIKANELAEASKIEPIKERIENVKHLRLSSKDKGAKELSKYGYRFRDTNITNSNSLVIPLTTTKRRKYIPIGFIDNSCIATNALSVIYDCETWLFSIISSKIHVVWIKTVCGKFRTHYRYSSTLGYNTFPFPAIQITENKN